MYETIRNLGGDDNPPRPTAQTRKWQPESGDEPNLDILENHIRVLLGVSRR